MKGALGAAIGAIGWGLRASSASMDVSDTMEGVGDGSDVNVINVPSNY